MRAQVALERLKFFAVLEANNEFVVDRTLDRNGRLLIRAVFRFPGNARRAVAQSAIDFGNQSAQVGGLHIVAADESRNNIDRQSQ